MLSFSDKIYEARHELLNLTTPLIKANIPKSYFSKIDLLNDKFAFHPTLALMTNRTESPLTHHHLVPNFGSQFEAIQNALSPNLARMQSLQNIRQRMPQTNFHNNLLSPHTNMSPRRSVSPTTSGYNSTHTSFNNSSNSSLEAQMGLFPQSPNSILDRDLLGETGALFDDDKTPTLLDVKVRMLSILKV